MTTDNYIHDARQLSLLWFWASFRGIGDILPLQAPFMRKTRQLFNNFVDIGIFW